MTKPIEILIVDDNQNNLDFLKEVVFSMGGINHKVAHSGSECLTILNDYHPDIVLLDVMMPGIDGYETCRTIKANPKQNQAKIIMITASGMEYRLTWRLMNPSVSTRRWCRS